MMHHLSTSERLRIAILGAFLALASCSLLSSADQQVFILNSVDGESLPAALTSATATDGTRYELQALRGILSIGDDNRFKKELDVRNVWNDVPTDTIPGRWSGTIVRTDTSVTVHFTDPVAGSFTITYTILDAGQRLLGVEGTFPPKTFEYVRQ